MAQKFYPIIDAWPNAPRLWRKNYRAISTGTIRPPKKGEYYLSGAIPEAYRAPNDLTVSHHIARIVRIKIEQVISIVD